MNQLNELTFDQLMQIVTSRVPLETALMQSASSELLRRINGNKQRITSIIDIPAVEKEVHQAQCLIKDLHERCDQAIKKILELEERSKPLGILRESGSEIKFTPTSLEGNPRPEKWPVWGNEDMVNFAHKCVCDCKDGAIEIDYVVKLSKFRSGF